MSTVSISWVTAAIFIVPAILLELFIRLGPKGRRTESVAAATMLFGGLEGIHLIDIIPPDQWPFVVAVIGYGKLRLRIATDTPMGQKIS